MSTTATAAHPRLALLACTSFFATLVAAVISILLLLVQVYIYLLNRPPAQLTELVSALLKTVAAAGTGLGVVATVSGFILRRINKRLAQAEQKRETVASVAGGIADKLQGAPQQIYRLSTGQGCAFPITVGVLGVSVVVATITYVPSQQIALILNNPIATPAPTAKHGVVTGFSVPTTSGVPSGITVGPDGAFWFTETDGNKIGKITPSGSITEFSLPEPDVHPDHITVGPDGNLWFDEDAVSQIGRVTPSGAVTFFPITGIGLAAIATGPDGALWYPEIMDPGSSKSKFAIGRITTSGSVADFPVPTSPDPIISSSITVGPEGNMWFTATPNVGRITPSGVVTLFPAPSGFSHNIAIGPDAALWFTESASVGRITTSGTITEFAVDTDNRLRDIVTGPDGNLWFTMDKVNSDPKIGRITLSGTISLFPPSSGSRPADIVKGPDGKLWFTDPGLNQIGVLTP